MTAIGYALSSEEHGPRDLVRNARSAEEAGFTFALISDHFHPWIERHPHSPFVWGVLGAIAKLSHTELRRILERGAAWAVERGYGDADDLEHTEERGCLDGADPSEVSDRAEERGLTQVGTLGSGNHFLEVQRVAEIHDADLADAFGLFEDQVLVMIHSGSRGLGYQICDDYIRRIKPRLKVYGYSLPDIQLAAAPLKARLLDQGVMQIVAVTDPLTVGFRRQAMLGVNVEEGIVYAFRDLTEERALQFLRTAIGTDLPMEIVRAGGERG